MQTTIDQIAEKNLQEWISTLKTKDPQTMVGLYHPEAVLLPTLDASIRNTPGKIKAYFESFLAKGPECTIQEKQVITLAQSSVCVVGHYGFAFDDQSSADARFTYIFTNKEGEWKISHHHSSLQP